MVIRKKSQSNAGWFYGNNAKQNLYFTENQLNRNEISNFTVGMRLMTHRTLENVIVTIHSINYWCLPAFLRVRTFFHQTFQSCHFYCAFILGYLCQNTENFGTLKDGILLINIFASKICFCDRNIFQNGVDAMSKNSNILHRFLHSSSFMIPLLLLTV